MAGRCVNHVLSIQSSVVYGYVGNKTATFPLQLHGFDVSPINTVQFSNHTEYGHFKGQVLNAADLDDLVSGMRTNRLLQFSHVLTGYIGAKSFLEKVADVIRELTEFNPSLHFVCDPVMGDNGHLYVPEDLVPTYRDVMVPIATVLTPNHFELELLTQRSILTEADAVRAMRELHDRDVPVVVLSSFQVPGKTDHLLALASLRPHKDSQQEVYRLEIPRMDATFVGTGDLFAASLLIWLKNDFSNLKSALEKTVATVQAVMKRTKKFADEHTAPGKTPSMGAMELQLVQSKADMENPVVEIHATRMDLGTLV